MILFVKKSYFKLFLCYKNKIRNVFTLFHFAQSHVILFITVAFLLSVAKPKIAIAIKGRKSQMQSCHLFKRTFSSFLDDESSSLDPA